jgi:hypothetical protein
MNDARPVSKNLYAKTASPQFVTYTWAEDDVVPVEKQGTFWSGQKASGFPTHQPVGRLGG